MKIRLNSMMFILLFNSCDWVEKKLCGEPEGELKTFIGTFNEQHSDQIVLKQVACYPGYAQVNLKIDLEIELMDRLESEILNFRINQKTVFVEVLIYDPKGVLKRGNTGSM